MSNSLKAYVESFAGVPKNEVKQLSLRFLSTARVVFFKKMAVHFAKVSTNPVKLAEKSICQKLSFFLLPYNNRSFHIFFPPRRAQQQDRAESILMV